MCDALPDAIMFPWRTIFFAINFGASVLMIAASLFGIAAGFAGVGNAPALLGGMLMIGPAILVAMAEWRLYVCKRHSLERTLGTAYGIVAGFIVFAFVSNVAEALYNGWFVGWGFLLGFSAVCMALAGYTFWCCWFRIRRCSTVEARGFPVSHGPATRSEVAETSGGTKGRGY